MKNLLLILLLMSANLLGYNNGFKGGLTYSNASQEKYSKYINYKTGIIFGFEKEYPLFDKFSLNWEILFNQKGVIMNNVPIDSYNYKEKKITNNYLQFIANVSYNFFNKVSVYLGLSYDFFLLECTGLICEFEQAGVTNDATALFGIKAYYDSFFIDFRYSKGLKDIGTNYSYSNEATYYPWEDLEKSQQFILMLGYKF